MFPSTPVDPISATITIIALVALFLFAPDGVEILEQNTTMEVRLTHD